MIVNSYCDYGCGNIAQFKFKNGKLCCHKTVNLCKAVKAKNSSQLKLAYKEGKRKSIFTDEHRKQTILERKNKVVSDLNIKGTYRSNCYLNRIIKEFNLLNYQCSECGISEWNKKNITLELDHINGDASNCKLTNLRYLCPNCHSQTKTYKGKNINTGKIKITNEELLQSIQQHKNIRQALIHVGLSPRGGNYARVARLLNKLT